MSQEGIRVYEVKSNGVKTRSVENKSLKIKLLYSM